MLNRWNYTLFHSAANVLVHFDDGVISAKLHNQNVAIWKCSFGVIHRFTEGAQKAKRFARNDLQAMC